MPSKSWLRVLSVVVSSALLSACATSNHSDAFSKKYGEQALEVRKSYLNIDGVEEAELGIQDDVSESQQRRNDGGFFTLPSMSRPDVSFSSAEMEQLFPDSGEIQVAANQMPLNGFIHYVFGELLGVNYMVTPDVDRATAPVTLNISKPVTPRKLFALAQTALGERHVTVKYNGDVLLLAKTEPNSKAARAVGMGREVNDIPSTANSVMQIVPVLYGIKVSLKTTIEQLADVQITLDAKQSTLFITGDREQVVRAVELVQLLDSPANRGRHVGLVKLTFTGIDMYLNQLSALLESEGIPNGIIEPGNDNLVFVPLYQIGAVAVFAASQSLLDRVEFWTKTLDQPTEGDVRQYYVYHPKFARAKDIGESLQPLIAGARQTNVSSNAQNSREDANGASTGQLKATSRTTGASNDELNFVVDERTNALIFNTTGTAYKKILPLVTSLDVLPKQVMLQITIAEVTLTDEFKMGVEFALSSGKFGFNSGFASEGVGDVLTWASGVNTASLQALSSNNLFNVLSNPNLLVRDGVSATIQVGREIPIVGSTTVNPNTGNQLTQSVEYRRTGTLVTVTPTINAQGVVIMNISQSNSNETEGDAASGNPNIFERSLSTEVVAENGQTILMGGLISEETTNNNSGLPGLRDIPLFGNLFGATTQSKVKTELVIMVTPRVISRSDQWDGLMRTFKDTVSSIRID
ncbi:hypothetical protein LJ739_00995 [Aestuariibacter halophilus]|uniref:Uncharacterized protein n=1 Tax=Fluctibacter halophilus TaxID=226011 RepID=A0ABS8G2W8_9ALTE|nr:secretin N-terminal domain-containing protein [Aestuariibacter halophilus]MCC2614813.1 hypothetical protein [Aestuariibacter halophilus]